MAKPFRRTSAVRLSIWGIALASTTTMAFAWPTAQTAAITYQGQLKQSGAPFNGSVDLQFKLFDSSAAGTQIGSTLALNAVSVADGVFTSSLDFGALAFNGNERWLEIAVDDTPGGGVGPFTTLAPRQKLASAPYAAYALNASLPATYSNPVNFTSALNAFNGVFTGSGFGLTSLNPLALAGLIDSGNIGGTYANVVTFNNAGNSFAGAHSGSGAGLSALNASSISSGTLDIARAPVGGNWSLTSTMNVDADTLVINPTNNRVGIGTASPTFGLDVAVTPPSNNINPVAIFRQAGASSSVGAIRFQNSASNHFNLGIAQNNDFALNYNLNISQATDLLRITPAGNVGMGTITPANRLDVEGAAAIGAGYAGTSAAPANGLIVEGSVGIGTAAPTEPLHIVDPLFSTVLLDRIAGSQVAMSAQGSAGSVGTMNAFPFRLLSNNSVRLTVTPTGDVGVGTTAPLAKLHVNGDLRVDGAITILSTVRYATVSPYSFVGTGNSSTNRPGFGEANGAFVGTLLNSGDYSGTSFKRWMAPVNLPDDAVITEFQVRAYDLESAAGVDLTVVLRRSPLASGTTQDLASVATSGTTTATPVALTDVSISNGTIDNSLYNYFVQINWPGTGTASSGDFGVYGVRIKYSVTSPLP